MTDSILDTGSELIRSLLTEIKSKKSINAIAYIDDPGCDKHKLIVEDHQESPFRTQIIRKAFQKYGVDKFLVKSGSISVRKSDLVNVHDVDYIGSIVNCARTNKPINVPEPSSEISMTDISSLESILAAVASVMGGVDTVCGGVKINDKKTKKYSNKVITKVFCNVRPPGHHAHKNHGAGFCFVNNVATGVKFAQEKYFDIVKKILIFDWDLHHGDGTQDIFNNDSNVMYVSFHRGGQDEDVFYPGTGLTSQANIFNYPIGKTESVESYMDKFYNSFLPLAYEFNPDLVMISAGFDSHKDDKYHELPLDYKHFQQMTIELMKLADKCAGGRLVSVLEGGYTLEVLYKCATVHVLTMINGY